MKPLEDPDSEYEMTEKGRNRLVRPEVSRKDLSVGDDATIEWKDVSGDRLGDGRHDQVDVIRDGVVFITIDREASEEGLGMVMTVVLEWR